MRIAVYAPFSSFADSYSLAHAVSQQVLALLERGHQVELWTLANLNVTKEPMLERIASVVRPCIGVTTWTRDKTTAESAGSIMADLQESIERFRPEAIITHDAVFQGWYIDSARAIHELADTQLGRSVRWFHVAHSIIGSAQPPKGDEVYRRTLPAGHTLLTLEFARREAVAAYYNAPIDRVKWCPNVHDARSLFPISREAERIADQVDLLSRDMAQVYPFCATRTVSKGVPHLLRIFRAMQRRGADAALILVDANACDSKANDQIEEAIRGAEGVEVFRTSRMMGGCRTLLPHRAVMDLMRLSNLFVFPSQGEACPLILIEAMAAGCVVAVNEAVPAMTTYAPETALRFRLPEADYEAAYDRIAGQCIEAVRTCPSAQAKARANKLFGRSAVGHRLCRILAGRE